MPHVLASDGARRVAVPLTDVPMTIDARVVCSSRVVEVDRPYILQADGLIHLLNQRLQSIFFSNVVTGCERVRSVETNSEWQLRTHLHDFTKMFEAMSNTFTLSSSILQKNSK